MSKGSKNNRIKKWSNYWNNHDSINWSNKNLDNSPILDNTVTCKKCGKIIENNYVEIFDKKYCGDCVTNKED